jgi:hypothetical protein
MKLTMLAKQLLRFQQFSISRAEVRLGFDEDYIEMSIERAIKEVGRWTQRKEGEGVEVLDGEIGVKPSLPRDWDGNAR